MNGLTIAAIVLVVFGGLLIALGIFRAFVARGGYVDEDGKEVSKSSVIVFIIVGLVFCIIAAILFIVA